MTKEVFSRVLDYNTGLTGASVLSALTIKYGAFQGFICQDYTVVQVITDAQGNDVTAQMGLRGVTLSPGIYISMAKGDSIYSIVLSSGSIILYDLGADMSSVPGVSDLIAAFSTRASVDGATLESTSCIDGPLMPYFKKASFYLTPSAYKGGKLYAQKPITGNGDLTWVRGSDAFRTNSSGLVQRMPWNLFGYSEQFDNAAWGKLSGTTVTANQATAPNGTLTADLITEGTAVLLYWNSLFSAGTYTQSFYAKKGTGDIVAVYFGSGFTARFNLTSGTIVSTNNTTATITNVGDGWYRITATATPTSNFYAGLNYSNSSGLNIYLWGAQLVEGTTVQTYLPTTDRLGFPRLDYTYGSCPSALLEPQRTNLALYSAQFDDATWAKIAAGTGVAPIVTANLGVAPDGTTTADRVQLNRGAGNTVSDSSLIRQQVTVSLSATTSISIYIKSYDNNTYSVVFSNSGVTVSQKITVTNQWQRITLTGMSAGTTANIEVQLREGVFGITGQSVTADLLLWGAQLEVGAYPTTYIPTTSATATRVADSFSRNNIYTNGLISASGGTWFVEFRNNLAYARDNTLGIFIGDTTIANSGNQIIVRNSGSSRLTILKYVSGTATNLYPTTTDTTKVAIKWNGSTADVFANGTKVISATSFTTTNMENFVSSGVGVPLFIQQMALFPTPLTDTECAAMTTI